MKTRYTTYCMNLRSFLRKVLSYKKFFITILVVFVFILGIVFFYNKTQSGEKKIDENFINVRYLSEKNKDPRLIDSDNDGVYDWKEELLGLNPHSRDTDNDGISDLEYVRKLEQEVELNSQEGGENLTLSDRFGRGVYTALYLLREANGGKSIDKDTKEKVTENIKDYIENLNFGEKLYTRDSLTIVEDNKDNDFAYEKSMKKIFKEYPVKFSDFKLLSDAVGKSQKYRVKIKNVVMRYDDYLHELEKVSVPGLIVQKHLQLMNAVMKLKTALANIDNEDDGIIVVSALSQYSKLIRETLDAIIKIQKYFQIIHEPGAFN